MHRAWYQLQNSFFEKRLLDYMVGISPRKWIQHNLLSTIAGIKQKLADVTVLSWGEIYLYADLVSEV